MFVLCPHCHFLVGIDPRTGKPPATCPKCGGMVVEPLPDMPADDMHAEETPAPLAPFAPVELPSVLPTLPYAEPVAEQGQDGQAQSLATAEPMTPEPVAAPAPASPVVIETAAIPEPKPRRWWWSRRKAEPAVAPAPTTPAAATDAPAAPITAPASPTEPVTPDRTDPMIPARRGRRGATRKAAEPPLPPPQPPPVVAVVEAEVEIDALPPAVQIEDVVATTTTGPGIETPPETPAEPPAATPAKRARRTSVATTPNPDPPATTAASLERAAATGTPAVAVPMDSMPIGGMAADMPAAPHPLRRRTDFDPDATPEPLAAGVPPHPLRRRTDAPSFTRPRVRATVASRIGWRSLVAVGGLAMLLAMQLLLAQRDSLAASPRWRPTIAAVCATLQCSLPPWHEPAAFTMLSRDVRPHPAAAGTLLINASFRNDARWPQPWPRLLLTLSDLDGRMVGARSFAAGEYLGAAPTQSELAPGQTAAVTLSVVEPAPNIVAFTFDFR